MKKEKLDKKVCVRVNTPTHKSWSAEAKKCGLNLADWVRDQIKVGGVATPKTKKPTPQKMPKRRPHNPVDPEFLREFRATGRNLNQLAKWVNTHKSNAEVKELLPLLIDIERTLAQLKTQESQDDAH